MPNAVIFEQFGLKNLVVMDCPTPEPGPDQVTVKVAYVSLNYRDLLTVTGKYNSKLALPLTPCSDGAGVIVSVGDRVEGLCVGDRVCTTMLPGWENGKPEPAFMKTSLGGPVDGLLREERTLAANAVLKIPDSIGLEQASCLPVAGLTAWSSLATVAQTAPGDHVLLLGTGGVSIMGLHIAKKLGAIVTITSSSDQKLARAQALGADHIINYKTNPNWSDRLLAMVPGGVDTVLEVGGDGTFDQSVKATRPGGVIALIGVLAQRNQAINLTRVLMKRIRVQGILVGCRAEFRQYLEFVGKHPHQSMIDTVFEGLATAREAFAHLASGQHFGKIVIRI